MLCFGWVLCSKLAQRSFLAVVLRCQTNCVSFFSSGIKKDWRSSSASCSFWRWRGECDRMTWSSVTSEWAPTHPSPGHSRLSRAENLLQPLRLTSKRPPVEKILPAGRHLLSRACPYINVPKKITRNCYWSYHLPGAFVCLWLRIYFLNIRRKLGLICPGSHVQSVTSSCLVTHSWRKVVRWLSGSRVDLCIFGLRRSRLRLDHTRWAGASAKAAVCFAKKITVLCPLLGWCLNHLCWFK